MEYTVSDLFVELIADFGIFQVGFTGDSVALSGGHLLGGDYECLDICDVGCCFGLKGSWSVCRMSAYRKSIWVFFGSWG